MFDQEKMRRPGAGLPVLVGMAAGLAATALLVRAQTRRAEAQHPPAGRFIEVCGVRLHYIEKGLGVPVLLIHGTGVTAEDYVASGIVDRLAERYRVIAFDRPGYGYSERPGKGWSARAQAELLQEACGALGIDRAIVVGHSWGTLVALEMALGDPGRVYGLVLVSGYFFPSPRIDSLLIGAPAMPVLGTVMRHTMSPFVARLLAPRLIRRMFAPHPVPDVFLDAVPVSIMLRPEQLRASAEDAARMVPTAGVVSRRYGELRDIPVSIMAGNEDGIVAADGQSSRLARALPHCKFEALDGAGHMLHYSHAERVARAVDRVSKVALPQTADAVRST
jgi:pimeloyl-ACP methyl ester carboxylesterase